MSNFKDFYTKTLEPRLRELETGRKLLSVQMIGLLVVGIIGLFVSLYQFAGFHHFSLDNHEKSDFIIALLLLVLWAVIGVLVYKKVFFKRLQKIRQQFKQKVIQEIVQFVDPNLKYFEEQLISKEEYEASKLFPVAADYYYGEDYMLGKSDNVSYKFSELHTQFVMKDHRGRKAFFTIFNGLFFIARLKENFSSHTIILPDTAQKYFGELGKYVNQWNIFRNEIVAVDNEAFNKEFVVYSDNKEETQKLMTSALVERITNFKKKTGHKVLISFVDNNVNVAIPLKQDLFEPPVFTTMLNYFLIEENYHYIKLIVGISDDLGLNN